MSDNNQLAEQKPVRQSALQVMAARFSCEPDKLLSTLKSTVFKNATNDELLALVVVANEYGLNPLTKEIYAFPAKGGGIVPVVSIDGWINLANQHPQMDGVEFEFEHDSGGNLVSCTSIIYRKDRSKPTRVTEYLEECKRATEPWKMKYRMLRHKALMQGVRVAFGFSGITDEDEAKDIATNTVQIVEKKVATTAPVLQIEAKAEIVEEAAPEATEETQKPADAELMPEGEAKW